MIYEVLFSKKANETFEAICSQLSARWGDKIVAEFEKRTLQIVEIISEYPFGYQAIKSNNNIRKAVLHKNCSMYYRIYNKKIVIAFFWDNRQDPIL